MFNELKEINSRPEPFEFYTADELWTNEHTAKQMLDYHLNDAVDLSSRNSGFIEKSVAWIVNYFNVNKTTRIIDFGCGPGLYTTLLAEQGTMVTGVDFSENSLNHAKKVASEKELAINYVHANYLDFETTDTFDLIIMIMCDFCALSPAQRKKMLLKFHSILKPGGAVLLDVHSVNFFNEREEAATYELNQLNGFWSPDDYYCFVNTFKYEKQKVLLDKYTIIEPSQKRTVYNWLQCFSEEMLKAEFEVNGFNILGIYKNVSGDKLTPDSLEMAVVAIKK